MVDLSIFFDESGKKQDKPHLMGALSIPNNIYSLPTLEELKPVISEKEIHWKNYDGDSKERRIITKIIKTILDHHQFVKMNIIYYDQSIIEEKSKNFKDVDENLCDSTIYMKLPERIVYGLIRNYGRLSSINAQIIIEEATEYKKPNVNLKEQLPKQLNIQAIYRGENFKIIHSRYASKGTEVGLESTDILLGMVRTIVTNPSYTSRKKKAQIRLIMTLLKDERFFSFLKQIKYYEWSSSHQLTEVSFINYLQLFMSTNYSLYME
ncbi:hypothetical protein [Alkalihalophilus marmarensis]|uniref:hypothetical protein n=1 Tax=Alkalihalophilus marmarensis TaxID=521377 RepID=UPI002DB6B4E4|nr:hypothetical protein [Alkalihalophilus marmarensis]MEC2074277.1 hypothetical protein [Alkalihalophilus marmarensis]